MEEENCSFYSNQNFSFQYKKRTHNQIKKNKININNSNNKIVEEEEENKENLKEINNKNKNLIIDDSNQSLNNNNNNINKTPQKKKKKDFSQSPNEKKFYENKFNSNDNESNNENNIKKSSSTTSKKNYSNKKNKIFFYKENNLNNLKNTIEKFKLNCIKIEENFNKEKLNKLLQKFLKIKISKKKNNFSLINIYTEDSIKIKENYLKEFSNINIYLAVFDIYNQNQNILNNTLNKCSDFYSLIYCYLNQKFFFELNKELIKFMEVSLIDENNKNKDKIYTIKNTGNYTYNNINNQVNGIYMFLRKINKQFPNFKNFFNNNFIVNNIEKLLIGENNNNSMNLNDLFCINYDNENINNNNININNNNNINIEKNDNNTDDNNNDKNNNEYKIKSEIENNNNYLNKQIVNNNFNNEIDLKINKITAIIKKKLFNIYKSQKIKDEINSKIKIYITNLHVYYINTFDLIKSFLEDEEEEEEKQ